MAGTNYLLYNPVLDAPDYPTTFTNFFTILTTDVNTVETLAAANAAYIAAIPATGFRLDDGVPLVLGNSSDTSLLHTGVDTYIAHAGTGDLILANSLNSITIGSTGTTFNNSITMTTGDLTLSNGNILGGTIGRLPLFTFSGESSINLTGIPTWARRVIISIYGVNSPAVSTLYALIGDSGGVEGTGYTTGDLNSVTPGTVTSGFTSPGFAIGISNGVSFNNWAGSLHLESSDSINRRWTATGVFISSNNTIISTVAGTKALTGDLDRIGIGVNTGNMTTGTVSVSYQ